MRQWATPLDSLGWAVNLELQPEQSAKGRGAKDQTLSFPHLSRPELERGLCFAVCFMRSSSSKFYVGKGSALSFETFSEEWVEVDWRCFNARPTQTAPCRIEKASFGRWVCVGRPMALQAPRTVSGCTSEFIATVLRFFG